MIGAHPDDEDTNLIAWLSRGRFVETAYLSLTRGDGGQNVIGNELGEALGVIRSEELLAARRVDGAQQYFTRAYDFGFSRDTIDTYMHWPRDTIVGDIVRVVRAFRPHVIIGVFSGTPRDGHGHHQVSGLLAREAYDASGDTTRFPISLYGPRWQAAKFYRALRGTAQGSTVGIDVGEFSPLRGESYGEIAGRSRSQHKSQGFGALERKGPIMNYLRREAARVTAPSAERSLFDGMDTTWRRLGSGVMDPRAQAALQALPQAFAEVRSAYDPFAPERLLAALGRAERLLALACPQRPAAPCARVEPDGHRAVIPDLDASVQVVRTRLERALRLASGVTLEVTVPREVVMVRAPTRVSVALYNRGVDTVSVSGPLQAQRNSVPPSRQVPPGAVLRDSMDITIDSVTQPAWLTRGRAGAVFLAPADASAAGSAPTAAVAYRAMLRGGHSVAVVAPVQFRYADDVRGEVRRDVAAAPAISVTLDDGVQYVRADAPVERTIVVRLRSADVVARDATITLQLPAGLQADSATRTVPLRGYDTQAAVSFRVRGQLPAGEHQVAARVTSGGEAFTTGYDLVDYDHIRRQRVYRPAQVRLSAVDVRVPAAVRVAYVPGVSDNVAPAIAQLGIPVTVLAAAEVETADLSSFTTVVIGPRAYEVYPELVSANSRLLDFARGGGTLVVQYGQYEMTQPGMMPYPLTINRPHDRVTHEEAEVTLLDANDQVLSAPNRITPRDFDGWVQERSLYMPRTWDGRYRAVLEMNDPGELASRGAVLVAPLGRGTYVYTSLALFRQLPAGVPGAARLMVNLLSAGLPATAP